MCRQSVIFNLSLHINIMSSSKDDALLLSSSDDDTIEYTDSNSFTLISDDEEPIVIDEPIEQPQPFIDDEDNGICIICYVNTINTIVLPCRHFVACSACSDKLQDSEQLSESCIICRGRIDRIYNLDTGAILDLHPEKARFAKKNMCRMCEEEEAATMVDPCGCIILCEGCSEKVARLNIGDGKCLGCKAPARRITYLHSNKEIFI